MIRQLPAVLALAAASAAHAIGPEDDSPPTPGPTTTTCEAGEVWDTDAAACVAIDESRLPEADLRRTSREMAYAGRSDDALALLGRSTAPDASEVLTLRAFANGRAGRLDAALPLYAEALAADPDNLLARAYMGLALIAAGRPDDAGRQLSEIRDRGGAGGWPDRALSRAIAAGAPVGY
ncbi:tetratricopeptide repeat protein [Roseibacterium sp. SDUM158017]|uniref:tetratricopeptide repeat protein n=1 Tax=Roseicyclus salinarum TaxID=3036773 RepID=UPI002414DDE5|nr:tetratricopeptide repeat protein [Roseibacterium sp. SDUM158017]MDG4648068.1 tetratricopeptide repeat protein [Roseibacterium sp. SDUM158017]